MLSTIRHDEVFDARQHNQSVAIIGAGAVGSRVFAALAELGLTKITTYDFDRVEAHNLANQIYTASDVGKPKIQALRSWYKQKVGFENLDDMQFLNECVTADTRLKGTVFLLVDSMAEREKLYRECIEGNPAIYEVIDVRMASTHGNIYVFRPYSQGDIWLKTLTDDDLAEVSACGSSLTVGTTASILANLAVWQFMHSRTDMNAVDEIINVYLKPLTIATSTWSSLV